MASQIPSLLVSMFIIYLVFRMIRGGKAQATSFNAKRARTYARSATSGNALLVLAAVQLSLLAFKVTTDADRYEGLRHMLPTLVPVALIGGLIFLVLARSIADAVIGGIGIGAALIETSLDYGIVGVVSVLILTVLVLFILTIVRGFLRVI